MTNYGRYNAYITKPSKSQYGAAPLTYMLREIVREKKKRRVQYRHNVVEVTIHFFVVVVNFQFRAYYGDNITRPSTGRPAYYY